MPTTTTVREPADEKWWQNPWVWLLIAIPACTVLGCSLTIYLALSRPHVMVDDASLSPSVIDGNTDSGRG